jgi:hypothetical protein
MLYGHLHPAGGGRTPSFLKLQDIDPIGILGTGLIGPGLAQALLHSDRFLLKKRVTLFTKGFFIRSLFEN